MSKGVFEAQQAEQEIWSNMQKRIFALHENYVQLFSACFVNSSRCDFVSLDFLQHFSNPHPSDYTDDLNGKWISLPDLWNNLLSEGMQHPFILRLCPEPLCLRLETGNQRITIFKSNGIEWVPCELQIAESPIGHHGNGKHYVLIENEILSDKIDRKPGMYKPSNVLKRSYLK
ncbi:MAG: hypothetical protein AB8G05_23015 [Oligoflexales bacterium]